MFDEEFFKSMEYSKSSEGRYAKTVVGQMWEENGQLHGRETHLEFRVYDWDISLGCNIEFYKDYKLSMSGYWTSQADFRSVFG